MRISFVPNLKQKIATDLRNFKFLNPDLCNEAWGNSHYLPHFPIAVLDGLARLIFFFTREFIGIWRSRHPTSFGKHLLVVGSRNNLRVANLSLAHVKDTELVGFHSWNTGCQISFFSTYLSGLPSLLLLPWYLYYAESKNIRRGIQLRLDQFILCCGNGKHIQKQIAKLSAKSLTHMNNTSVYCSLVTIAASKIGIPTIFIPHAAIGRHQMPMFVDFALLEGCVQVQQFPKSRTKIILTGASRLKSLREEAKKNERDALLFCSNYAMPLYSIEAACQELRKQYPFDDLGLRPHPAERRLLFHKQLCQKYRLEYVNPAVPIHEFSGSFSKILTTESGVVLDAAMCGMAPFIYESITMDDFFRFVELRIAKIVVLEQLNLDCSFVKEPDFPARLSAFDSSVLSGLDPASEIAKFYAEIGNPIKKSISSGM